MSGRVRETPESHKGGNADRHAELDGMDLLIAIAVAVGGYLIGSVSFARLIGRRTAPDDEFGIEHLEWREGVGFTVENVSATSVETRSGERYGCLTALLDIAKAFVPTLLLGVAYPDAAFDIVCATAVTLGHVYPVFYRFKGGRGTSTILGGLLALAPLAIPVTIVAGYVVGLVALKDVLFAHHAGWLLLLPIWFGILGQWDLVAYAIVVNIIRWSASIPELRDYRRYRKAGEFQTQAFHDAIEQTHIGYIHRHLRRRGWIRYAYMDE